MGGGAVSTLRIGRICYTFHEMLHVVYEFIYCILVHRWNDPDNKATTDKVLSEVKGQFPQFSEGDVKGKF